MGKSFNLSLTLTKTYINPFMTTLKGPEKDLWDKYKHTHQGVNELQF